MPQPNADLVLSPMVADDLDQVVEIERASFTNPWTREMFEGEMGRGAVSRSWVIRDRTAAVAGYCLGWLVAGELHISNLAVAPAQRRRGVGQRMLTAVLAEVAADGAHAATLEVRESNQSAINLYLRLGFRVVATRRRYYTDPVEDALVLWLTPPRGCDLESGNSL